MRAPLGVGLVFLWTQCCLGFFFVSPGSYREARQNYHEIMTHCEREGGECVDIDFGTTDPATHAPTTTPSITPRLRPTTRVPLPPAPVTQPSFFWNPFWTFLQTTKSPIPATRVPRPTTGAPKHTTRALRVVTFAPRPTTRAPRPTTTKTTTQEPTETETTSGSVLPARKFGKGRRRKKDRFQGEQEAEWRQRRQAVYPDPWEYLYNECTGGWEFDFGCGARGGNMCCYSSSSNY